MKNLFDIVTSGHRRVLLLQGPIGPFFRNLGEDLIQAGATVHKINFNGGDWLFYPTRAIHYRQSLAEWPEYLEQFLAKNQIDLILLFGDCRPVHVAARTVATQAGVEVGVFEEGYVRPHYITLERYGVNAHSTLPRDPTYYFQATPVELPQVTPVGRPFFYAMVWAMLYHIAGTVLAPIFPDYEHHRDLGLSDSVSWLRSFWRKWLYALQERGIQDRLTGEWAQRYFLVPLQLGNDAQIHSHSRFNNLQEFIEEVMRSFASHAPSDTLLVIKQHPLARGGPQQSPLIEGLAHELGISERVLYIHDQHLPTLLDHARGVVVINSTVGLSAIHQGVPLKNLGEAVYDMPDLTYQGELGDFWQQPRKPLGNLYESFHNHVVQTTQINGSFYRRLPNHHYKSGVHWK